MDWSGPYGGISAGGGFGDQAQHGGILVLPSSGGMTVTTTGVTTTTVGSSTSVVTTTTTTSVPTQTQPSNPSQSVPQIGDGHYHLSGGLVGGALGYNFQFGRYVLGVEGMGAWADISGHGTCGFNSSTSHGCGGSISALGTIRGRVGYDIDRGFGPFNRWLVFASGGLAIGDVSAYDDLYGNRGSKTLTGWTVGAGVEAMLARHWSVAVEYLHVDLGDQKVFTAIPPNPEKVRTDADIFQIGVRYRF